MKGYTLVLVEVKDVQIMVINMLMEVKDINKECPLTHLRYQETCICHLYCLYCFQMKV